MILCQSRSLPDDQVDFGTHEVSVRRSQFEHERFPVVRLAIIIVNYQTAQLTLDAVHSVHGQIHPEDRIFVVDAASPDDSAVVLSSALEQMENVEFLPLKVNGGFSFANNVAIRRSLSSERPPERILLLNPDTVARESAIETLVSFLDAHPNVGLVGSRLENPDGTTQLAAKRFHSFFSELDDALHFGPVTSILRRWVIAFPEESLPHQTDWVPGAALMIRREVFETIGLFDEGYFLYFEEVDFCLRAKSAGFPSWYIPQSRIVHFVGQATGVTSLKPRRRPRYWFESRARFWLTHYGRINKLTCDLAWTFGRMLFLLRCILQRKQNPFPPHLLSDFVRFNFCSWDAWKR